MAGGSPYISDAMWSLWQQCLTFIPGVRLGGIYANKSGYHNTVDANQLTWPGNYSIQLPYDLKKPHDLARAIDLTMDDAQMRLRMGYLQRSALHPQDDRLRHLREFYGTLNGSTVYGLIKDSPDGPWRAATSDSTHLWHCHESWLTEFVNDMASVSANASVLAGQTWEDWLGQTPATPPERGDDMVRLIEKNGRQYIIQANPLAETGFSWVDVTDLIQPHVRVLTEAWGGGLANTADARTNQFADDSWKAGAFGPSTAQVRSQFMAEVVSRVLAALPPSQGGAAPTLAQITAAVRAELDRTRLAGA